jgi:hypothetical protein
MRCGSPSYPRARQEAGLPEARRRSLRRSPKEAWPSDLSQGGAARIRPSDCRERPSRRLGLPAGSEGISEEHCQHPQAKAIVGLRASDDRPDHPHFLRTCKILRRLPTHGRTSDRPFQPQVIRLEDDPPQNSIRQSHHNLRNILSSRSQPLRASFLFGSSHLRRL